MKHLRNAKDNYFQESIPIVEIYPNSISCTVYILISLKFTIQYLVCKVKDK